MTNTAPIQEKEKRFHLIKEPDPYGKWSFINKLFFSKKVVSLSADGSADKVIVKKRGLGLIWFLLFVAIFVICISLFITFPSNPDLGNLFYIIGQMFQPCYKFSTYGEYFNYIWTTAIPELGNTIAMVFVATVIGCIISIPLFMLSSKNVVKTPWIYAPIRFILDIIRTVPTFALAMIMVAIVGYNNTAGIISMIFFTAGIMYKMEYEFCDTRDMAPYEAALSVGSNKIQAFSNGLWPQILPNFLSNCLYTFEISIRGSIILGYVGAGGIGKLLSDASDMMYWDEVGAIVIPIFVVTLVLQLLSNYVRRKVQ